MGHLRLLKHPQKHHYFILIHPALEQWLLNNAEEVSLEMSDFDLPNDFDELCRQSKTLTSKRDERFKQLFRELKRRDASGVVILAKWVTYLKENTYVVDISFFTA